MSISSKHPRATHANPTSKFVLGVTAAAVFSVVTMGVGSAAANAVATSPSAVVEFPAGLTMRNLGSSGSSSILISGGPAGGTVTVESHLEIPLGNGEASSLPVSLLPALIVPDEGVVSLPLLHFIEFLEVVQPSPQAQLVVAARCNPDGPWESRKVPLEDSAPPIQAPAPLAPPVPTPTVSDAVPPGENAPEAVPADANRSVLPETGVPTGLTGPVGLGVLLALIGGAIISVRSRVNGHHRAARG
jgi:hypothetical protein